VTDRRTDGETDGRTDSPRYTYTSRGINYKVKLDRCTRSSAEFIIHYSITNYQLHVFFIDYKQDVNRCC